MLWDQPWDCFWDEPEDFWSKFDVLGLNALQCRLIAQAYTAFEQNAVVVIDGVPIQMNRVLDSAPSVLTCAYPDPRRSEHIITLVGWGDAEWPLYETYPEDMQSIFSDDKSRYREVTFTPPVEYFVIVSDNVDSQLSNWNLTGLARYWTGEVTPELRTRMTLRAKLTSAGAVKTLQIYQDESEEILLAQGSRTGNGSITLTAQNSDIVLSGTVDLTYTADITGDLLIRYPATLKLYVDNVLNKTLPMDPRRNNVSVVLGPFTVGDREFKATMISDDGKESAAGTPVTETIVGPPLPCSNLHYVSGDDTATVIAWTASGTGGASTNVNASPNSDPPDFDNPVNTALTQITLDPYTGDLPGTRPVVIDSTLAGVESGFRQFLEIEYDENGDVVAARPNVPAFALLPFGTNNLLQIQFRYSHEKAKARATAIRLYVTDNPSGFSAWGSPVDTVTLDPDEKLLASGTLDYAVPSQEVYYWLVRAVTAGGVLSENTTWQGGILVRPTAPPAPSLSLKAV